MTATIARQAAAEKKAAIEDRQRLGVVDSSLPAETILQMILQICRTGLDTDDLEAIARPSPPQYGASPTRNARLQNDHAASRKVRESRAGAPVPLG